MLDMDTIELKNKYEMYNRMQNKKRQDLLVFIYESDKNYTQLMEYSNLKPGSLYHHLNVLIPLIEKKGHGLYTITELGKEIVEGMKLVTKEKARPKIGEIDDNRPKIVKNINIEKVPIDETIDTIIDEPMKEKKLSPVNEKLTKNKTKENVSEDTEILNSHEQTNIDENIKQLQNKDKRDWDDPLSSLWLGTPSYLIIGIIAVVSIILATQGIALAGSAIYAVNNIAFAFDIFALLIGIGLLYYIELGIYRNQVYNKLKYITIIRVLSMLPATVMGLGILLITFSGVMLNNNIIPWLFSISIIFGTLFAASGISYLRGTSKYRALVIASVPSFMDLFLGIIIILNN